MSDRHILYIDSPLGTIELREKNGFVTDLILRSLIVISIFGGLVLALKISEDVQRVFHSVILRIKNIIK